MQNFNGVLLHESLKTAVFNHRLLGVGFNYWVKTQHFATDRQLKSNIEKHLGSLGLEFRVEFCDPESHEILHYVDADTEFCVQLYVDSPFHTKRMQ